MTTPPVPFTLHVRNLRALQNVVWSPEDTTLLIGANGSGKSTLLLALKLLRAAYDRGLPDAVTTVLGGSSNLRSWGADEDEPIEIGVDIGDLRWRARLVPHGATVDFLADESLVLGDRVIFEKDSLGNFKYGVERLASQSVLGLRALIALGKPDPELAQMAAVLRRITVFHDPDLWSLRTQGSRTTDDRHLHSRGTNALTMLRRWSQERPLRNRYQFVVDGLKTAFPRLVTDIDFQEAGQTLVARLYRPGREEPGPLASEANGVLQLLVLLCDLAASDDGGLVAIDEPEDSLHPYALRCFIRRASAWTAQRGITLVLATHSTVLLDEFSATPERVFIMRPSGSDAGGEIAPTRLVPFRDARWLASFKLGELYEQGEIGSNEDEP